jgi:hypothetical protein
MDIVGIMVIKDGIKMGYPWVEAILAVLPWCDFFHISEGYSEDDTWGVCHRLAEKSDKISLSRYEWPVMGTGFAIGAATNYALSNVRHLGGKVLNVQADELWHPDNMPELRRLAAEDFDGYEFPYLHLEHNCQVVQEGAGYHWAIRMVSNKDGIVAHRDAWTFEGCKRPLRVCSLEHPLVHCNYCFWDNVPTKKRVQADVFYQDLGHYAAAADQAEREYTEEVPELFTRTSSPYEKHLPPVFLPMLGQRKYYVRDGIL